MLKKLAIIYSFLSLSACSAVVGPVPQAVNDWPFGNKNHVTLTTIESNGRKLQENEKSTIEIYKNSNKPNNYVYSTKQNSVNGNIWFKNIDNNGKYGLAITTAVYGNPDNSLSYKKAPDNQAIYSVGTLSKNLLQQKIELKLYDCAEDNGCVFTDEAKAWDRVQNFTSADKPESLVLEVK